MLQAYLTSSSYTIYNFTTQCYPHSQQDGNAPSLPDKFTAPQPTTSQLSVTLVVNKMGMLQAYLTSSSSTVYNFTGTVAGPS